MVSFISCLKKYPNSFSDVSPSVCCLHSGPRTYRLDHARTIQFPRPLLMVKCLEAAIIPNSLEIMLSTFDKATTTQDTYQQLIHLARELPPLPNTLKKKENLVSGCVSKVWVVATRNADGSMLFKADSDSVLTKGLCAILVNGLSNVRPETIIKLRGEEISKRLRLPLIISPSRNNGFLNMLGKIQQLCLAADDLDVQGSAGTST
eukprot:Rmarinus@m.22498